ncbi:hypothetical protein LQ327_16325 [Actinomycetospora endophytica]|uniref:Mce-associated membrane protein n=1 Tax=Actinomycetospora endophytica TaxID=2291215 RepID=A0ABS8P9J8_9PSEU|nr:hypothetical protein [Actinomycetospora endophytica]MCD2194940.1 hypothetical protein [Actinomycetospora endophytica]
MRSRGLSGTRVTILLAALLAVLVVAGVVLGVVGGRASAHADDEAAVLTAVRTHLTDLVAAPSSPTARTRAVDGATGPWRARLESGTPPTAAGSAVVVRAVGLESLDGDSARVLAAARVADGSSQRAWRVDAGLTRADGRWLVSDLREVP